MNKTSTTIKTIVEIGLFAAIGFVLDELQGIIFTNVFTAGGSIGFAMIAVLIISFRRGWLPGLLVGLIMGALDLATKAYIINGWQVLLDYILPYALVAVSGFFKPMFDSEETDKGKIIILTLGTFAGGILKFLSHFIVGALVWAQIFGHAWSIENDYLYSFAYNIAFVGPSIVLCLVLLIAIYKRAPSILTQPIAKEDTENVSKHNRGIDCAFNPTMFAVGMFLFIFYMIQWIKSFASKQKTDYLKTSFNIDYLTLMIVGLLLIIITVSLFILALKKKQDYRLMAINYIILAASQCIYGLARLLTCYIDEYTNPTMYYVWLFLGFFLAIAFTFLYLLLKKTQKNKSQIKEETNN